MEIEPAGRRGGVKRRAFLTGSLGSAVAAGAAASALRVRAAPRDEDTEHDPRKTAYRETDHIRQFYRLSRF